MIYKTRTIEIDPTNETLLSVDFGRADAMKFIFDFGSFDTSLAVKSRVFAYRDTDAAYCFGAEFTQAGVEIVSSSESASASTSSSESESLGNEWLAYFSSVRTSGYSGALRMTVQLVDANGDLINSANILCNVVETNATTPFEPSPEFRDEVLDALAAAQAAQAAAQAAQAAAEAAQEAAETAQGLAESAKTAAETAKTNAETAETNAETAETNAETAQGLAETAQGLAEAAQAEAEQSASNAAAYAAGVDSKRLQPVGRYQLNGGSITTKSFFTGSSASYAITLQGFIGTLAKGSIVITSTAGGLSLTDGVNTISATGLSTTDALATQFIFTAAATKIVVNGTVVAEGAFAVSNTNTAVSITGTSGFVSRMKVFNFDMSAVGAPYTIAQYNAGVEEPPFLKSFASEILNNSTLYPIGASSDFLKWYVYTSGNASLDYIAGKLRITATTTGAFVRGAKIILSTPIRKGTTVYYSVGAGAYSGGSGRQVLSVSYGNLSDFTQIATGAAGSANVMPAIAASSFVAANDIYAIWITLPNGTAVVNDTYTFGNISVRANGALVSLGDEAHVCQIPDESGNQNCAFFTQNVGFDNVKVLCDMSDILPFASGATAGLAVGGNSDKKPMQALSYNAVRVRLSPASTLTSAAFKLGTVASSTAYSASITITKTWQTVALVNDDNYSKELIITPVSALGSAGDVQILILKENIQFK